MPNDLTTAAGPPEAFAPFVLICICLAVLYTQFAFIIVSAWVSSCSAFEIRPDSDKVLLKWQLLSTGLGFVSTAFETFFWSSAVTDSQCRAYSKISHFFFFMSMSVLYFFYESRLNIIRIGEKRSRLETFMLCLTILPVLMGIVAVSLAEGNLTAAFGGVYCVDTYPVWTYIVTAVLGLVLNPGYLYFFVRPLKTVGENIKAQSRHKWQKEQAEIAINHFREILIRNRIAAFASTVGIVGLTLINAIVANIREDGRDFHLVFVSLKAVQVTLWCTCMFISTLSIWQKKQKRTTSHTSSNTKQLETSSSPKKLSSPEIKFSSPETNFQVVTVSVPTT
eukprot:TRINITY_DN13771_c0_g1_i1.p1 TRINITY_DN13771_c0_g1~~TRINITY_DN13771_c0_g1_i1.p1  ORF type:complete len:365 (+),score=69.18 TRINITY_DN13771_c0_g1_i1:88-1095(+)